MKLKRQRSLVDEMERSFLDEAKQIEEEIEDVQLGENPIDKEKLRTAILMEGIETEHKENPKPRKKTLPRKIGHWAAMLVLCLVGIFGFSMTSQGNRIFLVQKVEEFFDNKVDIKIDNNKKTISNDNIDEKVKADIEKELEVDVPIFYYKPEGMQYMEHEKFPDVEIATIYYEYKDDNIITFNMSGNNENFSEGISIDGILTDSLYLKSDDLEVGIWTLENEINDEKAYCAQWVYKNTFYRLQGVIEQEELVKILENMYY
ncbi:DUF4367 domain-containing protein [Ruminococcus sp. OA3]|uniref:DUF4367 domain-containing protein n=1 Tax=Ruminococcus sp. OA3 TaxID=2914164 RepID=UPI001F054196|nr:DUF4367 domain-containing protein [Ruminococcus sp. OA3]MCH1981100.1 DUF4367 domain-containing protein [Ruminococcus sp. OA3]